jgi:superfamily I DNA and RNA helicase/SOS-response transcriptional repressor LexA
MEFLPTVSGEETPGERKVWNDLKDALRADEGIACLQYPIYVKDGTHRYEPDVLILHRQLGLLVIEVKDCRPDNVAAVEGPVWRMADWHSPQITPGRQIDKQVFALRRLFGVYPALAERLRISGLLALPYVAEDDWAGKGLVGHPNIPPVIHQNHLGPVRLRRRLYELTRGDTQPLLSDEDWALACQVLELRPVLEKVRAEALPTGEPLVDRIRRSEAAIPALDLDQLKIGLEIPPGPQRLRGIAGSGKTLLLAMKAARMHLSHPDWDVAVVFNTKSLYQVAEATIARFCRHFGDCEPDWNKLRVLHGWGGKTTGPGLYSVLAEHAGHPTRSMDWAKAQRPNGSPGDLLAALCEDLLASGKVCPAFDAILIDEGQDFAPEVYRLAYEGLRAPKRLVWAYDEAQSLDSLRIPNAETLFGRDEQGALRVDLTGYYLGGIQKSRVMRKCYRTPSRILMPAHAFGMGLLRPAGAVQLISTQQGWHDIGYQVEGNFEGAGRRVVLTRPAAHCPHPLERHPDAPLLAARPFDSREAELAHCAKQLVKLHGLGVSLDEALVVFLGSSREKNAIKRDMETLAGLLALRELRAHLAEDGNDRQFRRAGAVTLSRIHRAKGNEAAFVFVVGLDRLAASEHEVESRNQLFVALTRARGMCRVSGVVPAASALLSELDAIQAAGGTLAFHTPDPTGVRIRDLNEAPDRPPVLPFVTHLPLVDLKVAAGRWPGAQVASLSEENWVHIAEEEPLNPQMFAVRISGDSMAPRIPDGAVAVFQAGPANHENKIVLAGLTDATDAESAAWVVKRLVVKQHAHGRMEYCLRSENPAYAEMPLGPAEAERLRIQGVFKWVLPPRS